MMAEARHEPLTSELKSHTLTPRPQVSQALAIIQSKECLLAMYDHAKPAYRNATVMKKIILHHLIL